MGLINKYGMIALKEITTTKGMQLKINNRAQQQKTTQQETTMTLTTATTTIWAVKKPVRHD